MPTLDIDTRKLIDELPLLYKTDFAWVDLVHKDFHLFLNDHAANERKAAAAAMALVVQYPDRESLVTTAARVAEEEILHFRQVFQRMKQIGATLLPDERDEYVNKFRKCVRSRGEERLLDRLLVNSLIETRGIERFLMLGSLYPDESWRTFYKELSKSEIGHGHAFKHEAMKLFSKDVVEKRWKELLVFESDACQSTPLTYRFH